MLFRNISLVQINVKLSRNNTMGSKLIDLKRSSPYVITKVDLGWAKLPFKLSLIINHYVDNSKF